MRAALEELQDDANIESTDDDSDPIASDEEEQVDPEAPVVPVDLEDLEATKMMQRMLDEECHDHLQVTAVQESIQLHHRNFGIVCEAYATLVNDSKDLNAKAKLCSFASAYGTPEFVLAEEGFTDTVKRIIQAIIDKIKAIVAWFKQKIRSMLKAIFSLEAKIVKTQKAIIEQREKNKDRLSSYISKNAINTERYVSCSDMTAKNLSVDGQFFTNATVVVKTPTQHGTEEQTVTLSAESVCEIVSELLKNLDVYASPESITMLEEIGKMIKSPDALNALTEPKNIIEPLNLQIFGGAYYTDHFQGLMPDSNSQMAVVENIPGEVVAVFNIRTTDILKGQETINRLYRLGGFGSSITPSKTPKSSSGFMPYVESDIIAEVSKYMLTFIQDLETKVEHSLKFQDAAEQLMNQMADAKTSLFSKDVNDPNLQSLFDVTFGAAEKWIVSARNQYSGLSALVGNFTLSWLKYLNLVYAHEATMIHRSISGK